MLRFSFLLFVAVLLAIHTVPANASALGACNTMPDETISTPITFAANFAAICAGAPPTPDPNTVAFRVTVDFFEDPDPANPGQFIPSTTSGGGTLEVWWSTSGATGKLATNELSGCGFSFNFQDTNHTYNWECSNVDPAFITALTTDPSHLAIALSNPNGNHEAHYESPIIATDIRAAATPEPATFAFGAVGFAVLVLLRRRYSSAPACPSTSKAAQ